MIQNQKKNARRGDKTSTIGTNNTHGVWIWLTYKI